MLLKYIMISVIINLNQDYTLIRARSSQHYIGLTVYMVQEILQIQQGSLSELLSEMDSSGLIERKRNPEDRRQVVISLTPEGKEVEHANHQRVVKENMELFSSLSQEEQDELYRMLRVLLEDWKAKNPQAFPEEKRGMRR